MQIKPSPYTQPEQTFFLTKESLKTKHEKMFEHFKARLTDHLVDRGEFSFIVFEPNMPVKFGNTRHEYRSLFSPSGLVDMGFMFSPGTVFLQVEQGYGFITTPLEDRDEEGASDHWRNFEGKDDIPSEVLAAIHLLGIPDYYADRETVNY